MKNNELLRPLFYFSYAAFFTGSALKITHTAGSLGKITLAFAAVLFIGFMILSLAEIYRSKRLVLSEKIMWTTGFLFFNLITGLLYFFVGRNRITRTYNLRSPVDRHSS